MADIARGCCQFMATDHVIQESLEHGVISHLRTLFRNEETMAFYKEHEHAPCKQRPRKNPSGFIDWIEALDTNPWIVFFLNRLPTRIGHRD